MVDAAVYVATLHMVENVCVLYNVHVFRRVTQHMIGVDQNESHFRLVIRCDVRYQYSHDVAIS